MKHWSQVRQGFLRELEAYNLLRYGNRTVTPEQLEVAEQYLKNM